MDISKNQVYRMKAGSEEKDCVYFKVCSFPFDLIYWRNWFINMLHKDKILLLFIFLNNCHEFFLGYEFFKQECQQI